MIKFTQAKLDELREKAIAFIREDGINLNFEGKFIEMQGEYAIFVVRLIHRPHVRVGMPLCVAVSKDGSCTEIRDHKEINRILNLFFSIADTNSL